MDKIIKKSDSAKQIRDRGYGNTQIVGINKPGAEDFFIMLRDAIVSEYTSQGYCEMVDEYLYGMHRNIDVIVYAAISQISSFRPYQKGTSVYVPIDPMMSQQPITWESAQVGYVFDCTVTNIIPMLSKANNTGHKFHQQLIRKNTSTSDSITTDGSNLEIEKAKNEAKKIIADAKNERNQIIANAKEEADKILRSVGEKRDKLKANNSSFMNTGDVKTADGFIEKYIAESQRAYKLKSEQEISLIVDRNQKNLSRTEEFHDQMCEKTNELQVTWMKTITFAIEEMNSIKEEFYKHLHEWQKGLYPHEYEQIAERYIELYRIIDVDRIIADEIVKEINSRDVGLSGTTLVKRDNGKSDTIGKLQKLNETLRVFLHKFEASLNGLGLYVFRVEEGMPFDYVWHMNVDDSVDCEGKNIKRCVVPGIAKRVIGDGEDDVIIPALVSV